jgi:pyruvate dehydrogenase (quinone)
LTTVAEQIITALADLGVKTVWGVVGDALNPVTDAIRREPRIEWIGVRHEEVAAFAAGAQAQLTGVLGVCMGTVGPGSIHLLNGLYDAKKSHAPVLAICGQVPLADLGSDYFQEVDNDLLFRDVAEFRHTVSAASQLPRVLEQAVHAAYAGPGVAVLTLPGDIGSLSLPKNSPAPRLRTGRPTVLPNEADLARAAALINAASTVTMLVGTGARGARAEVLALADHLSAPMVLTLKAKDGLEAGNPFQVGQSGLIGNPASKDAFDSAGLLLMVGTDFPYPQWLPAGTPTVQLDQRPEHIGRRTPVDVGLVADAGPGLTALLARLDAKPDRNHLDQARTAYTAWRQRQRRLVDPAHDQSLLGRIRSTFDNTGDRIRPEALAAAVDAHAADDAIFTSDTGMSTVWLSRFVELRGTRRLIGSYNLGSMANAMPQALGAQAIDRTRPVVAFCGDGGLTMLLGDLITAVSHRLPVKFVVFDNGRLGMVKLEQEQGGLPEFGTQLANPDLAAVARSMGLTGIRVTALGELDAAVAQALATPGPVLLDVLTNPEEISLPPKTTAADVWGFAIAKLKENLVSPGDKG